MKNKTKVDRNAKRSKNGSGRTVKGVSSPSIPLNLLSYIPSALCLNVFSLSNSINFAAVITLLLIGYSGTVTCTTLVYLQYGKNGRSSYRNMQARLAMLLAAGWIDNDGKGNYSLSVKAVGAMREVLVSGESAKILHDIDKRIARSEAYRQRKAKGKV